MQNLQSPAFARRHIYGQTVGKHMIAPNNITSSAMRYPDPNRSNKDRRRPRGDHRLLDSIDQKHVDQTHTDQKRIGQKKLVGSTGATRNRACTPE